jgi:ADP-ribose pyrophosphatase YjhB (NUDIX family)
MATGQLEQLRQVLKPFESTYVRLRRVKNKNLVDLTNHGFNLKALEVLRKGLARMSRQITQAHQKRAGVVLPLCNVNGVACVLFEKRSRHLRAHPDEVCLPGGLVSMEDDNSIVGTCLREMEEEIGIRQANVTVLGTLRCNWGEVARITGVAVTPVVCFVGELAAAGDGGAITTATTTDNNNNDNKNDNDEDDSSSSSDNSNTKSVVAATSSSEGNTIVLPTSSTPTKIVLNYSEVSECFTVSIASLLDKSNWIHRNDCAPIFVGGPYIIWGLTGYIVDRFVRDILVRYTVTDHR